mmetsp:Transcript_42977/g.84471  ORF Transcript_42977/g.84471 Transcript_42977/m.84471 type:complete len:82 (-) Transcript_42977:348-593(-)
MPTAPPPTMVNPMEPRVVIAAKGWGADGAWELYSRRVGGGDGKSKAQRFYLRCARSPLDEHGPSGDGRERMRIPNIGFGVW